jgi:hypothetical protein
LIMIVAPAKGGRMVRHKLRPLFDIWKAAELPGEANVSAVQSKPHLDGWLQGHDGKIPGCGK